MINFYLSETGYELSRNTHFRTEKKVDAVEEQLNVQLDKATNCI